MRIVNETRESLLADRAELASSTLSRMKGLLGRDGLSPGGGLVITPCTSVHTFFMRFSIDVLFLNREGIALAAYERLRPWRMTRLHPTARLVVELPEGTLSKTGTVVGDRIDLRRDP